MADLARNPLEKVGDEKFRAFAARWAVISAVGSFLLYLLGYLTLRFQLSTYGLATNLDLFDEKYMFAGCRFLVYLVASVPSVLIVVLPLAGLGYIFYRLMPASARDRSLRWVRAFAARPLSLPLLGTILATAFIQFVLRKCFSLGNLLLRKELPHEWISSVLLLSDGRQAFYFSGLVAGTLLTAAIFWYSFRHRTSATPAAKLFLTVLGFLVAVEFLLLPVNYGVLISTQQLPRLEQPNGKATGGDEGWLLWDSKDSLAFFSRTSDDKRMIISVPRKDSEVRIGPYDDIYCVLFSADQSRNRPCPK